MRQLRLQQAYDAASEDEDPTKHWIGREVKRFIAEAPLHVPFLLQLAAAPMTRCRGFLPLEMGRGGCLCTV